MSPIKAEPLRLVLDTNIVLDCFVFHDRGMVELTGAIVTGRVQPIVHQDALGEFMRVLAYPQFRLNAAEQRQVFDRYQTAATLVAMPDGFSREALHLPAGFPRCRDRDDETFLALAFHSSAYGLVTKDRALLKLRRKVKKFSIVIMGPKDVALWLDALPMDSQRQSAKD
ncbi:MAG: putative toxin-antitoxin system toxin component, PIN family [Povalibacter sp.]